MKQIQIVKVIGDLILVYVSYFLAYLIRFGGVLPYINWYAYLVMMPCVTLLALLLFYFYGLYNPERCTWEEKLASLIASTGLLCLITIVVSYIFQTFAYIRPVFVISALIQLLLLCLWRRLVWVWSAKRVEPLRILVIGSYEQSHERAEQLIRSHVDLYQVVGLVVDDMMCLKSRAYERFSVWSKYSDLVIAIESVKPDCVLFCTDIPRETKTTLILEVMSKGLPVLMIPEIYEIVLSNSHLEQLDGIPVFRLTNSISKPDFVLKRLSDVALVILFAIPAFIVLVFAIIALKIESPSAPVFFFQDRIGRRGEKFMLIKLRTMIMDAERFSGPTLASTNDPRITKVGHVIRALRIDEIPQLFNVLKGNMSLIGPRPERPFFVEKFRREIYGYDYRHQVKAGITGLAQVNGRYTTSAEDKLRYDLFYINTQSFIKDLFIMLNTIKIVFMRNKTM